MVKRAAATVDLGGRVIWGKSRDSGDLAGAQNEQEESWISFSEQYMHFRVFLFIVEYFLLIRFLLARGQRSVFISFLLSFAFLPPPKRMDEHKFSPCLLTSHIHTHHPMFTQIKKTCFFLFSRFLCSLTTLLTATLCPSRFHWGPDSQPSLWQDRRDSM